MNLRLATTLVGASAVTALAALAALSPLQAAEMVHVRGAIVSLDGSTLTVKTREGPNAAVALKPGFKVAGTAKTSAGATRLAPAAPKVERLPAPRFRPRRLSGVRRQPPASFAAMRVTCSP